MKDLRFKATFENSNKVVEFYLSDIIYNLGHQCAEDVSLEEEVGEDLAYLNKNWHRVILELNGNVKNNIS